MKTKQDKKENKENICVVEFLNLLGLLVAD